MHHLLVVCKLAKTTTKMVKFIVIFLSILILKSVEMEAVPEACADGTECNENGIMKKTVNLTDVDSQPETVSGKTNFDMGAVFGKDCVEQNCSRLLAAVFPVVFSLDPADEFNDTISESNHVLSRVKRYPQKCNDMLRPTPNTFLTCCAWPNYLHCEINCAYGFAIKEGNKILMKTERKCPEHVPYWFPHPDLPRCQPYINCETDLIGPGTLACNTSSSVDSPGFCNVMCYGDSEHDEVPMKRYECVDEKYSKILPFCASTVESERLIGYPVNI